MWSRHWFVIRSCHKLQKHGSMIVNNFWFALTTMSLECCWSVKSSGVWCCVVGPVDCLEIHLEMLDPEDEEITTLRNFGKDLQTDTAPHHRRTKDSTWFLCFLSVIYVRYRCLIHILIRYFSLFCSQVNLC